MIAVETRFPTGNGRVTSPGEGDLVIDRDLRDSTGDRWYWHVRLRACADTAVQVRMARPLLIGLFGPALSSPGPYTWLHSTPRPDGSFDLPLTAGRAVALCATLPYSPKQLAAFRRDIGRYCRWHRLGCRANGEPIPLFTAGSCAAKYRIVLTARHHACEAMASFVLEGAVGQFLSDIQTRRSPARRCELIVVPMVDFDGVVAGDQGKARQPWDHNRDYGVESRYAAVRALRDLVDRDPRPSLALDFHTPGLRGPLEERPYVIASGDSDDAEKAQQLLDVVATVTTSTADLPALLVFDEDWNSVCGCRQRCFAAYIRSLNRSNVAFSIEYPNAVLRGTAVTPERARRFGATILSALLSLL